MDLDSINVNRHDVLARVRRACRMLPDLATHMAVSVNVKQRGDGRGAKTAPPLPMNDTALAGVHALYALYADLCVALRAELPAATWRDASGRTVGLGEYPEPERVHVIFTTLADLVYANAEHAVHTWPTTDVLLWNTAAERTFRFAANFPREDAPEYVSTPCWCGERIVKFPPEYQYGDPWMVCSGCGRTYDQDSLAVTRQVALAVAKYVRRSAS